MVGALPESLLLVSQQTQPLWAPLSLPQPGEARSPCKSVPPITAPPTLSSEFSTCWVSGPLWVGLVWPGQGLLKDPREPGAQGTCQGPRGCGSPAGSTASAPPERASNGLCSPMTGCSTGRGDARTPEGARLLPPGLQALPPRTRIRPQTPGSALVLSAPVRVRRRGDHPRRTRSEGTSLRAEVKGHPRPLGYAVS